MRIWTLQARTFLRAGVTFHASAELSFPPCYMFYGNVIATTGFGTVYPLRQQRNCVLSVKHVRYAR